MEALRCATLNGSYLTFDEGRKGSLEVGKLADLVVLSADPSAVTVEELPQLAVEQTWLGGVRVH
jgi:predicted amidohydrolase YtcJ